MHGRILGKLVISQKCHVDDLVEAVDETAKERGWVLSRGGCPCGNDGTRGNDRYVCYQ